MVSGLKLVTSEEKPRELDRLIPEESRQQSDLMLVYRTLHGHGRVNNNQWFRLTYGTETGH